MVLLINYVRGWAYRFGIDDGYLVSMSKYLELPIMIILNFIITAVLTSIFCLYALAWGWKYDPNILWQIPALSGIATAVSLLPVQDLLRDEVKKVIITTIFGYVCLVAAYVTPVYALASIFLSGTRFDLPAVTYPSEVIPMYTIATVLFMLFALDILPWVKNQALGYTAWKTGVLFEDFDDFVSRRYKYRTSKADLHVMRSNMDFFSSRIKNCVFLAMMSPFIAVCYIPQMAESALDRKPLFKEQKEIATIAPMVKNAVERIVKFDLLTESERETLKKDIDRICYKERGGKLNDLYCQMSTLWGKWIKENQINQSKVDFFEEYWFEKVESVEIDGALYGTKEKQSVELYYDKLIRMKIEEDTVVSYNMLKVLLNSFHNGNSSHRIVEYLEKRKRKLSQLGY